MPLWPVLAARRCSRHRQAEFLAACWLKPPGHVQPHVAGMPEPAAAGLPQPPRRVQEGAVILRAAAQHRVTGWHSPAADVAIQLVPASALHLQLQWLHNILLWIH